MAPLRRIGLPGPHKGHKRIHLIIAQWPTVGRTERIHAKIGLPLGNDISDRRIVSGIQKLCRTDRWDHVACAGRIRPTFAKLPVAGGAVGRK